MNKKDDLPIIEKGLNFRPEISRREAARRLLAGVVAGAALPWVAPGHPIWKHFADVELMDRAEAVVGDTKLHFLNTPQFEALASLAEAIVPGSSEAKAAAFIDLLLSVEEKKHQMEFVSSLMALESVAGKKFGRKIAAISSAEKNELLTYASSLQKTEPNEESLRKDFDNLKEWISGAYYSSEMGMRELGWTPDRVFAEFPGCSDDAAHS